MDKDGFLKFQSQNGLILTVAVGWHILYCDRFQSQNGLILTIQIDYDNRDPV